MATSTVDIAFAASQSTTQMTLQLFASAEQVISIVIHLLILSNFNIVMVVLFLIDF